MICTATVEWTFGHKWTTSFNLEFSGSVCNCIMFDFHQLAGSQLRAAHNGSYFSHTSKEGTAVMQQAWPDMARYGQPFSLRALVSFGEGKKDQEDCLDPRHQQQHISGVMWRLKTEASSCYMWHQPWGSSQGRKQVGGARPGVLGDCQGQGLGMVWLCLFYGWCGYGMLWNVMDMDVMVSRQFWGNSELKYVQVASLWWFVIHQYFHVAAGEVETYHKLQRQDV